MVCIPLTSPACPSTPPHSCGVAGWSGSCNALARVWPFGGAGGEEGAETGEVVPGAPQALQSPSAQAARPIVAHGHESEDVKKRDRR